MMSKKSPQLRFEGFTDDWEERKLGEISRMYQPLTITGNDLLPDGVPVFGANGFIGFFSEANHIEDQVTISARGEGTGTPSYVHGPVWITGNSMVVNVDDFDINKYFLFANLTANSLKKYVTGGAQPQLTRDVLVKVPITLPNADEQQKIASFFQQLDNTITLHQHKLDLLKEQKKGFLQKMVPKNGDKVPELRFAGFADDWEQRKLGELAESFEYGLNASAKKFDGSNKYIRITDIDDINHKFNQSGVTSPDIDFANADNYKLKKGDILFARTGASVGKTYMYRESDGLVYYAGFLIRARIKSKISSEFVFQTTFTDSYNQFIKITSQRSGQPGVNAEEYSNFKIMIPNYEEQDAIGCFFKKVDDTIALHQRKLDLLKEQKKGFLQKMFV